MNQDRFTDIDEYLKQNGTDMTLEERVKLLLIAYEGKELFEKYREQKDSEIASLKQTIERAWLSGRSKQSWEGFKNELQLLDFDERLQVITTSWDMSTEEIKSLKAEVQRLTEDRDGLLRKCEQLKDYIEKIKAILILSNI